MGFYPQGAALRSLHKQRGHVSQSRCWFGGGFGDGQGALLRLQPKGGAAYSAIASISGTTPMIRITRFKLYASTCKLISVLTCSSVRVRKCV